MCTLSMTLQLLGVAYDNGFDENALRAVCFNTWSHFNSEETRHDLRARASLLADRRRAESEQAWADEGAPYASSPEQFT